MTYQYDNLYRLTRESILGASPLGDISYGFDPVGNRLAMTSTVFGIPSQVNTFDVNDRLGSDTYDVAGNTKAATIHDSINGTDTAFTYSYDFDNRILCVTSVSSVVQLTYDGDGNRVQKTVTDAFGTRTTRYLVDQNNLTGYSQVLEELDASNNVTVAFTVGLDVISQTRFTPTNEVTHYFGYDGHGNTRFLTGTNGTITDRWDYDAYGNIIARSGATANNLLYCGEYLDPDLGLYFLRARYMEPGRGRFWTVDEWQGRSRVPLSLHKYLYVQADPANRLDPSGQFGVVEVAITVFAIGVVAKIARPRLRECPVKGVLVFRLHGKWCGPGWCGDQWVSESEYDWPGVVYRYPRPLDAVDSCCLSHDACVAGYRDPFAVPLHVDPTLTKDECDRIFCRCVRRASCKGSSTRCRVAKTLIGCWCSIGAPF